MPKILIADDDDDLTTILGDMLQASGYECVLSHKGLDTYELAQTEKPDLIILDWQMPMGKGSAVLEMLGEKESTRHIPVIILSGADEPGMLDTVKVLGAKDFVKKPYEGKELLSKIKKILDTH